MRASGIAGTQRGPSACPPEHLAGSATPGYPTCYLKARHPLDWEQEELYQEARGSSTLALPDHPNPDPGDPSAPQPCQRPHLRLGKLRLEQGNGGLGGLARPEQRIRVRGRIRVRVRVRIRSG